MKRKELEKETIQNINLLVYNDLIEIIDTTLTYLSDDELEMIQMIIKRKLKK